MTSLTEIKKCNFQSNYTLTKIPKCVQNISVFKLSATLEIKQEYNKTESGLMTVGMGHLLLKKSVAIVVHLSLSKCILGEFGDKDMLQAIIPENKYSLCYATA